MNRLRIILGCLLALALAVPASAGAVVFSPRAIDRYTSVAMWPSLSSQKYFGNIGGMAPTANGDFLWVSDQNNDRILKVSTADGSVVQVVGRHGDGNAEFHTPAGIAIRPSNGDVLVCDYGNGRIQVFSDDGEFRRTFGTYGTGNGQLATPRDIVFDSNGDIFVAEEQNKRVQKFTGADYMFVKTIPTVDYPRGLVVVGSDVLVAEFNGRVNRYPEVGVPTQFAGSDVFGADDYMIYPSDLATTAAGEVLALDESLSALKKFGAGGSWIENIAAAASGTAYWEMDGLYLPRCVATYENTIYVADTTGIKRYNDSGPFYAFDGEPWAAGRAEPGYFYHPKAIACGASNGTKFVWTLDTDMQRIQKFSVDIYGRLAAPPLITVTQGACVGQGTDLDVDVDGNLYVSDYYNNRVYKLGPDGTPLTEWQAVPGVANWGPRGLDVHGSKVYVTDSVNNVVRVFGTDGSPDATPTVGGDPSNTLVPKVAQIRDVAVTGAAIFVLDGAYPFVKKYRHDGTESPLNDYLGSWGHVGFGPIPDSIAADWLGNVYVTGKERNRVAKFDGNGVFLGDVGSPGTGSGELSGPIDVKIDSSLDVFALEYGSRRIQTFRPFRATKAVIRSTNVPAYNTPATFSFDVLDADGKRTNLYHPLQLRWSYSPTSGWSTWWNSWGAGTGYSTPWKMTRRMYFQVRSLSDKGYLTNTSAVISVAPKVILGTPNAPSVMYRPTTYTIKGSLKPRHTAGTYPVRIYKYRWTGTAWKSYGYVKAVASNYSTYSLYSGRIRLPYTGKWMLKAYAPADSLHAATWSAADYVTVK